MGQPDLSELIAMSRPEAPAYQPDEKSGKDVIRPVPLRTTDGRDVDLLIRPGDPRYDAIFAPKYDAQGRQINTMAPDPLPGEGSAALVVPGPAKPRRSRKRAEPQAGATPNGGEKTTVATSKPRTADRKRVSIYYGRLEGQYIAAVESGEDWDTDKKVEVNDVVLGKLLPILEALEIKVKNNTMEEFGA